MNPYYDLVKSAAVYSQQTAQVVETAYGALQDIRKQRQKVAATAPKTLQALSALKRTDGRPFVPSGYEKQANDCLQSHSDTLRLLTNVLGEYAKLKEAADRQMPSMGKPHGSKTASSKGPVVFDSPESNAMKRFIDLLQD